MFVHIFEQTFLMKDWLGREQFLIEEVEKAKKGFPLNSIKFVENPKKGSTGKMVLQLSGCYWHPCFLCGIDCMFLGLSLLVFT